MRNLGAGSTTKQLEGPRHGGCQEEWQGGLDRFERDALSQELGKGTSQLAVCPMLAGALREQELSSLRQLPIFARQIVVPGKGGHTYDRVVQSGLPRKVLCEQGANFTGRHCHSG